MHLLEIAKRVLDQQMLDGIDTLIAELDAKKAALHPDAWAGEQSDRPGRSEACRGQAVHADPEKAARQCSLSEGRHPADCGAGLVYAIERDSGLT
jgi:hypothetical protein